MERIQSAIAKARAQRGGAASPNDYGAPLMLEQAPGHPPASSAPAAFEADVPASAVVAAWEALPALRLERRQLIAQRITAFESGNASAHYDVMRTRMLQQMRQHGWKRIAITSPSAGCGKSTVALNLAFSLSRQPDQRAILAEVDLRRPSLARVLGIRESHSFAEVLAGTSAFETNALRHGSTLALATNQRPSRNPAELLQGSTVVAALQRIEADYAPTTIIFDMPPLLVSDDTMAFAQHVDAVLIVVAAERTTIKEVDLCERELASQTNVMGVVLNQCRFIDKEYGYSAYS